MLEENADYRYIKGLLNNDNGIIREIYRIFQPKVIRYVTRNSGKERDGKDVFQKALVAILERSRKGNFRLTSRFENFLMVISRNIWLNDLRGNKAGKSIDDLNDIFFDKNAMKEQEEQDQEEEREEFLESIKKYITTFSGRKQLLLYLRLNRELNFKEIAALMEYSSENSARQAYFRIITELREQFRDDNNDHSDNSDDNNDNNDKNNDKNNDSDNSR